MKNILSMVLVFSAGSVLAQPYPHVAPTEAKTPEEERKTFQLPAGFEAQLVAGEPDILKPMQMAFDAKGRLWVTTSQEYPFPATGRPGQDKLIILSDFDANGKAKTITTYADDLNIPIGILPLPNCTDAVVFSIPNIWLLKDTDGDGKADQKEILYGPFGHRDTHGMVNSFVMGLDGWVYACHGFANDSTVKGKDGQELKMNSGNTFRFRLDGSRMEAWTRGQVNPFGMTMDAWGSLYTADCHSKPITQLIHKAHYDSFGKPHDGLGYGPDMIFHSHDSTALCGLVYYQADHFPKTYQNTMFLGNVTGNRINHNKIEWSGSSPKAELQPDFLVSRDLWFRPVDLKLGLDGALYVADFYNKIIGHYEVDLKHPGRDRTRGRIWRIVYTGKRENDQTPQPVRSNLTTDKLEDLIPDLGHANLTVRWLTYQHLYAKLSQADTEESTQLKRQLLTAAISSPTPAIRNMAARLSWNIRNNRSLLASRVLRPRQNPDQQMILRAISDTGQMEGVSVDSLAQLIEQEQEPAVRRAAAEIFITYPSAEVVPALVHALQKAPITDTHLRHTLRIALREQLKQFGGWKHLPNEDKDIFVLAEVCLGLPERRAGEYLLKHRDLLKTNLDHLYNWVEHATQHVPEDSTLTTLVDFVHTFDTKEVRMRLNLIRAIARGLQKRNGSFSKEAVTLAETVCSSGLQTDNGDVQQLGIELIGTLKLQTLRDPLAKFADQRTNGPGQRGTALTVLASLDASKAIPQLTKVLSDANEPIGLRERACQSLGSTNQPAALDVLIKALETAPSRLASSIALSLASTKEGGEKLLQAVAAGKASARLLQEKPVQDRLQGSKIANLSERLATLTKNVPTADQRMVKLMNSRKVQFEKAKPDVAVGMQVFVKNCATCHQVNNQGAKIGPQLDGVGGRGLERLLEDILDPSRNVDQSLRQTVINTKDGQVLTGLILREEGKQWILANNEGKEVRIEKDNIEEKRESMLSPMPANFHETIPEKDFHNLMAYLLTLKPKQ